MALSCGLSSLVYIFSNSHLTTKYYENFLFNDSFSVYCCMQPEHAFCGINKIN